MGTDDRERNEGHDGESGASVLLFGVGWVIVVGALLTMGLLLYAASRIRDATAPFKEHVPDAADPVMP